MIVDIIGDWRSVLIRGIAAVAFGVLALVWPDITLWALVVLFGAFTLVDGAVILATVIPAGRGQITNRGLLILDGLLSVGVGILTLVWPDITALALLYVIAFWAFIGGAVRIAAAVRLRREIDHEWLLGLSGLLSIVFAVMLVITPGAGALVITWLIGWYAVIFGALLISLSLRLRKAGGRLVRRAASLEAAA
jgi:uncharacterized membrane protein HdeD (DUF308 family)